MNYKKHTDQNVISRFTRGSSGMIFHNNKTSESTGFRIKSGMTQGLLALTLLLGLAVTGSAQAAATPCANGAGTVFNGADGATTYCKSNIKMNWWSAFAWCEGAGMELVSLEDCSGASGTYNGAGTANCPNFTGGSSDSVWTASVPTDAGFAYAVNLSSGAVNSSRSGRNNGSYYYALCN